MKYPGNCLLTNSFQSISLPVVGFLSCLLLRKVLLQDRWTGICLIIAGDAVSDFLSQWIKTSNSTITGICYIYY